MRKTKVFNDEILSGPKEDENISELFRTKALG